MEFRFSDLVDTPAVQKLMDNLWEAAGLPAGIIDVDGTVLVATGWQEICTEFHRRHPQTAMRCRESDAYIQEVLAEKRPLEEGEFVSYRCRNGLVDIAMPIIIQNRHLATLFLGQFLYEPPDEPFFRKQARQFGFAELPYFAALGRVPIFSPPTVKKIIAFHRRLVDLLVRLGAEKLQRVTVQRELAERQSRLRRQNEELLRLGALRVFNPGALRTAIREILESVGRILEVERVSLWRYNDDRSRLRCLNLYEGGRHIPGRRREMAREQCPAFFQALEKERHVAAADARGDLRTRELLNDFLMPAGVVSLLATPVRTGSRRVGVLCCGHVGSSRPWTYEERNFAGSMADFFSLAIEGSERRRAEEALRESEKKYRLLFSAESDAILILDAERRSILEVNDAAALLYGFSKEEFSRMTLEDISAGSEEIGESEQETLIDSLPRHPPVFHRKRDGTVFPAEISSGTFHWKGRRRLVAIVRDITERQNLIKLKDDLLSAVSHEMRTPLTAIIGFADYLRLHPVSAEEQQHYLGIICSEGERLKELTDNLLDLQRWRAGFGTENFREVPLLPLLQNARHLFAQVSPKHPVVLVCTDDPPPVFGNEKQLYRVLQNLLSNAIKYSPDGGTITLGARREGDFAVLWVQDEGIGIPENVHAQIFDRFFRVDAGNNWIGGTGLGLALVKAVAQGHKGRVWVESVPGRGSTFFLSLPLWSTWEKILQGKAGAGAA